MSVDKDLEEAFFISGERLEHTILRFVSYTHTVAQNNTFTSCLTLEIVLTPKIFQDADYEAYMQNQGKRPQASDRVSRNFYQDVEVGDDTTEFRGLYNEGSTCYINSLLQTLFTIGKFRNAIYRLEPPKNDQEF